MKVSVVVLLVFLLGSAHASDGQGPRCRCATAQPTSRTSSRTWSHYNQGVKWHTSLQEARELAAWEGKLVFHFALVGNLDAAEC